MAEQSKAISIIVPLLNERDNVEQVVAEIDSVMADSGHDYEIVMVDDGSIDGTVELLTQLQATYANLRIIELRRNFGQTSAIAAGFDHARGAVIVPMDGDLQNDPADIPRLVARLDDGYDVVSGWRRHRKDKLVTRKIPSWVANWLIGKITGVKLHDYGCSLKAYRRDVVQHLNLYGEMHRFIPAIARWYGANVTEMEVNHRPRLRGKTKYGISRTMRVVLDLLTVKFLGSFSTKPLHIFGSIGMLSLFGAMLSGAATLYQKYISSEQLALNKNPLLICTTLLILTSVQFLLMGLLAEMLARTYHESQGKPIYVIRHIIEPSPHCIDGRRDSETTTAEHREVGADEADTNKRVIGPDGGTDNA